MKSAVILALCSAGALAQPAADPARLATEYAAAVRTVNEEHTRKLVAKSEVELSEQLPEAAARALARLVESKDAPGLADALPTACSRC